jgi:hypothetical protein
VEFDPAHASSAIRTRTERGPPRDGEFLIPMPAMMRVFSAPKGVVQALRFELVKDRFTAGSNGSHLAVHLMESTGGAAKNAGALSSCLVSARV